MGEMSQLNDSVSVGRLSSPPLSYEITMKVILLAEPSHLGGLFGSRADVAK